MKIYEEEFKTNWPKFKPQQGQAKVLKHYLSVVL